MNSDSAHPPRKYLWQQGLKSNSFFYLLVSSGLIIIMMAPFLAALSLSMILVMARIQAKKRLQSMEPWRKNIIISASVSIFLFMISMIYYCGYLIFQNIISITSPENRSLLLDKINLTINPLKENLISKVTDIFPQINFGQNFDAKINESFLYLANLLATGSLKLLTALPDLTLLLVFSFIAYLILNNRYHDLKFYSLIHFPEGHLRDKIKTFWDLSEKSAYSALVSTLSVSLAQGSIISVGAWMSGLSVWPLYFVMGFIFSFFPVIGLLPVIIIGLIHTFLLFGYKALVIFLVFGILSTVVDNLLRTLITAKESSEINPYISFFCLIGSMYVFGFAGIVLGPFLISFASLLKEKARDLENIDLEKAEEKIPSKKMLESLGFSSDKI